MRCPCLPMHLSLQVSFHDSAFLTLHTSSSSIPLLSAFYPLQRLPVLLLPAQIHANYWHSCAKLYLRSFCAHHFWVVTLSDWLVGTTQRATPVERLPTSGSRHSPEIRSQNGMPRGKRLAARVRCSAVSVSGDTGIPESLQTSFSGSSSLSTKMRPASFALIEASRPH